MDVAILFSPVTYAAAAVVFLCAWAAVLLRNAADRLTEVPKLHYLREEVGRKAAECDGIEQKIKELRADLATAIKEKVELATVREEKQQRANELANVETQLASLAEDIVKIAEVEKQWAMALDRLAHVRQELVDAETKKAGVELAAQGLERQMADRESRIAHLMAEQGALQRETAIAKQQYDDTSRAIDHAMIRLREVEQRHLTEDGALANVRQSVERLKDEEASLQGSIGRLSSEQRDISLAISTSTEERRTIAAGIAILTSHAEGHQRELTLLREESTAPLARGERAMSELRRRLKTFLREEGYSPDKGNSTTGSASCSSPWRAPHHGLDAPPHDRQLEFGDSREELHRATPRQGEAVN